MNNNPPNQSYWFVLREDQSNVIFSSNNFTIQNAPILGQEAKYIVDSNDRQFIHINEATPLPEAVQDLPPEPLQSQVKIKDENFWDRSKIKLFLTLCLENNLKNINKDKPLLDDIAAHLGTSTEECNNKYKNLRRTFVRLLKKKRQGKEIKWVHYNICEKVFSECKSLPSSMLEPWSELQVTNLLNLYLDNLGRFRSSDCLHKDVWKDIASQIGTTEYNCYHKFKNLKRAYINWLQRSKEIGKTMKWPYHEYFERIFYEYSPRAGPWNRIKTKQLIETYIQLADKFKNPRFQKKDLWKEISIIVNESAHSCDRKFRNLKQTYLNLKMKSSACFRPKWRYFKDFEAIYGKNQCDVATSRSGEDYIKQLLQFYVDNKDRFRDPRVKKKHIWRLLGPKIGLSSEECDRKFRNFKQTYIRLSEKKNLSGKTVKWPYYNYFEKIFDDPGLHQKCSIQTQDDCNITDIKRIIHQLEDKRNDSKFEKLIFAMEESNNIQRERNKILQALLDRK